MNSRCYGLGTYQLKTIGIHNFLPPAIQKLIHKFSHRSVIFKMMVNLKFVKGPSKTLPVILSNEMYESIKHSPVTIPRWCGPDVRDFG
jgi:hypothetical protein